MIIIIRNENQKSNKSRQYVLALTSEIAIQENKADSVAQTAMLLWMTRVLFEQNRSMKFDGNKTKTNQQFVIRCTYNNKFRSTFVLILPKSNEPFRVSFWKRTFWHLFSCFLCSFTLQSTLSSFWLLLQAHLNIHIIFFRIISGWVASCVFLSLSHSPVFFSRPALLPHS